MSAVSTVSSYPDGCQGQQTGIDYLNAAVEPSVAVDPNNSKHLIGVWQQNRWGNGAADGLLTAVSMDGGVNWTRTSAPFTQCTGGMFARASDPWVTISPNGTAYQSAIAVTSSLAEAGVLVSRSTDGGFSWSQPIAVASDTLGDDKATITADPTNSNYVYAVWDRTNAGPGQPVMFSRTSDGGLTWSQPKAIYSVGYNSCNQIVVLPHGTLVDVFTFFNAATGTTSIEVLESSDKGDTWFGPFMVSSDEARGVVDARTQASIRTGTGIPSTAVDPISGTIYMVWDDARFSGNQREGVAFSKSVGGLVWSAPVQVNRVPEVQAFNPAVAVAPDGAVAITYYDFRQAGSDVSTLPTNYWQIVSADGGANWRETPVAGPFDMLLAARSGKGYFLGDYQALVAAGDGFVPFFVATNSVSSAIPSSIFALARERRGNTDWDGHTEINRHPRPPSSRMGPKAKRK